MDDFSAKIRSNAENFEDVMGVHAMGDRNDNGEILLELYGNFKLQIGGTLFVHKTSRNITWVSPDGKTDQINHICVSQEW